MNDEMQRTMQFILEHQAQFAVNQQKWEENQRRWEDNQRKTEENQQKVEARVTRLEENMVDLARAQAEMARTQTHVNEVMAAMIETHRYTEEKLDAFIGVLERYISSGQNNGSSKHDAS